MKRITSLVLFVAITLWVSANPIALRLKLSEGQEYKFRNEIKQTITQTVQGMEQVVQQNTAVEYKLVVQKPNAQGNFVANLVFSRMTGSIKSMGQEMSFDSENGQPSPIPQFAALGALAGKGVVIVYSPLGEVVAVEGAEKLVDEVLDVVAGTNEAARQQMRTELASTVSEEFFKQTGQFNPVVFPEESKAKGANWSTTDISQGMVPMNVTYAYTLKEADANGVEVGLTATLVTKPGTSMVNMGIEMGVSLFGTVEGSARFDLGTGVVKSSLVKQTVNGSISASMGGDTMNIPMSIVTESSIERL